jgi:DNA uptake protein ComE-like DNA-binding protein
MNSPARQGDRAFVLIAVLVIVGGALLVATSVMFIAHAELAGEAGLAEAAQSRALAWSGVQAVMSRLDEQRDVILDSEMPQLEGEYVVYETPSRIGLVRLLSVTPDGAIFAPEAGKLDLNAADAPILAETGLVDASLADAIIQYRDGTLGRPYQSVAELLHVPGMTPEILYGEIAELTVMDDAMGVQLGLSERIAERLDDATLRGLADAVTVYGFEPALQRDGTLRINLNVPWSDELGRRVDQRFGEGASGILKRVFDDGTTFDDEAKIFQVLRSLNSDPEEWPDIVDAITTESGEFHFGRLDINTAPFEALVALEGIDAEQASQIVDVREDLSIDEKATIAWPAIQGIVEPEAYDDLAGHITTRCWTYRLRLAAGEVDAGDPEGALINPAIYEIVVDLSAPRPRIAYLRDITLLQTAAVLAVNASSAMDEEDEPSELFVDDPTGAGSEAGDDEEIADDPYGDFGLDMASGGEEGGENGEEWDPFEDGLGAGEAPEEEPAGIDDPNAGAGSTAPPETADASAERRRVGRWQAGG